MICHFKAKGTRLDVVLIFLTFKITNMETFPVKIGDRLVRKKDAILMHHGIFVGYHNGQCLVAENNTPNGVAYVTCDQFLDGQQLTQVEPFRGNEYQRSEVIPFINSRLNTPYDLLRYNCEHFATEVQTGQPKSNQVLIGGLVALGLLGFATLAYVTTKSE